MSERISTHWDLCWKDGGPRHYDCAVREVERLKNQLQVGDLGAANHLAAVEAENDRLRAALMNLVRHDEAMIDTGILRHFVELEEARAALGEKP